MMRFRLVALCFSLLLGSLATAQTPRVLVQMQKRSRYLAQIMITDKQFPDQQFLNQSRAHFRVTDYSPNPDRMAMVMSTGAGQLFDSRTVHADFPEQKVQAHLEAKRLIKFLKFTGENWELISAGTGRPEDQDVVVSPELPEDLLDKRMREGYALTSITNNPVYWALVFTKAHDGAAPLYFSDKNFPTEKILDKSKQGFEISALHYNANQRRWLVGMRKTQEGKEIRLWAGDELPLDWIDERWVEGYQITGLYFDLDVKRLYQTSNVRLFRAFQLGIPSEDSDAQYLIKLYPNDPIGYAAFKQLLQSAVQQKDWGTAIMLTKRYLPAFPRYEQQMQKLVEIFLKEDTEELLIERLGSGVNTRAQEYKPVPTADGQKLYFTGLSRPGGVGLEDIFVSDWEGTSWGPAKSVSEHINTERNNESMTSVSADGLRISYFGQRESMFNLGDNYYSVKTATGWSTPQEYPEPINSDFFESDALLSSDGRALFFVSTRSGSIGKTHLKGEISPTGGFGNTDIYVVLRQGDGWSEPINLGPNVNTEFAERTPFLHPDGKTLYFSSGGHGSIGGLDVFKVERTSETDWTQWSEPVNLGKRLNTHVDDWGYKITTDGQFAYYAASSSDAMGGADIYRTRLPDALRPEPVATIRGTITNFGGEPLSAELVYENLANQELVGQLDSDPQTGRYFIAIPLGKNYGYTAQKDGYYPVSRSIDLTDRTTSLDTVIDIQLTSIEELKTGKKEITINNVFFDFDKATLKPSSRTELNRLAQFLEDNPSLIIEIGGHTDNQGTAAYNDKLSQERADAVKQYLVDQGIPAPRLKTKGYGFNKPIATNETPVGRAKNRRVAFKVINQ